MSKDVDVQECIRKQWKNIEYRREMLNKRRRKILKKLEEKAAILNKEQSELQRTCSHFRIIINQRFRTGHCPDCGDTFLEHELTPRPSNGEHLTVI